MESGVDVNALTPAALRRRDISRVGSGRNRANAKSNEMIQRLNDYITSTISQEIYDRPSATAISLRT